jgi:hypothetical protein
VPCEAEALLIFDWMANLVFLPMFAGVGFDLLNRSFSPAAAQNPGRLLFCISRRARLSQYPWGVCG